jgi:D-3-phosphoglycerate dehydrogenase / 2-oxoglutarate reductase
MSSILRCLIIDDMHESIIPMLRGVGIEVFYCPNLDREEVISLIGGFEGLIVRSKVFVDEALLQHAAKLKFIGRAGAGLDNIDVAAVENRGIQLFHAAEGNRDAVGEHAVGMLLSLMNNMLVADSQVRSMTWNREGNRGYEIQGKTVGIIGYGNMGQSLAKRLSGFGCRVLAYDKYVQPINTTYARQAGLDELKEEADIVSFHIPLTKETRGLVDYNYLKGFAKPLWLLNTARGEILELKDLLRLLDEGHVRGAALDVLQNEKLHALNREQADIFNDLIKRRNVLLTPHVAGWTYESYFKINQVLAEKIRSFVYALS